MESLKDKLNTDDPAARIERSWTVGVDLGQSHDPTAIAVVERFAGFRYVTPFPSSPVVHFRPLLRVRHLERLPLGTPYPAQVAYVASLLRREPLASADADIFIDYTGVGRPVFDLFRDAGVPGVKAVSITSGLQAERTPIGWSVPKTVLVSTVQAKLHCGDLEIAPDLPEAQVLRRELQDFRVRFTYVGNPTFNAREGAHDDLVLALAMAVFGAENRQRITVRPLHSRGT